MLYSLGGNFASTYGDVYYPAQSVVAGDNSVDTGTINLDEMKLIFEESDSGVVDLGDLITQVYSLVEENGQYLSAYGSQLGDSVASSALATANMLVSESTSALETAAAAATNAESAAADAQTAATNAELAAESAVADAQTAAADAQTAAEAAEAAATALLSDRDSRWISSSSSSSSSGCTNSSSSSSSSRRSSVRCTRTIEISQSDLIVQLVYQLLMQQMY